MGKTRFRALRSLAFLFLTMTMVAIAMILLCSSTLLGFSNAYSYKRIAIQLPSLQHMLARDIALQLATSPDDEIEPISFEDAEMSKQ